MPEVSGSARAEKAQGHAGSQGRAKIGTIRVDIKRQEQKTFEAVYKTGREP